MPILGFGRIGRRLVKRCVAMEMEVLADDYVVQDGELNPKHVINKEVLGLAPLGPLLGVLRLGKRMKFGGLGWPPR